MEKATLTLVTETSTVTLVTIVNLVAFSTMDALITMATELIYADRQTDGQTHGQSYSVIFMNFVQITHAKFTY
jgi:hypothetical protein